MNYGTMSTIVTPRSMSRYNFVTVRPSLFFDRLNSPVLDSAFSSACQKECPLNCTDTIQCGIVDYSGTMINWSSPV